MSMPRIKQNAFTLIEMLAVIVIIALLAATIIPALIKAKSNGEATRCKGNLENLYQGCLNCANDGNNIPIPAATPIESHWRYLTNPNDATSWGDMYQYKNGWVNWTVHACVTNSLATLWTGANLTDTSSHAAACDRAIWWGQAGIYSIRYGGIWENCGQAIGTYLCPTFAHQSVCGRSDAVRSYVMNAKVVDCKPLTAVNASRTLLFTDMQPQKLYLGNGPATGICTTWADGNTANVNGNDGALDANDAIDYLPGGNPAYSPPAMPYESIGFIHQMSGGMDAQGRQALAYYAQCVFLDGHIEAIPFIQVSSTTYSNLTYVLCTGAY